jgi:hypothetical protein
MIFAMPSLQRALYGATRGIVSRRARSRLKVPARTARHVAVDTAHGRPAACGSATDLDSFLLLEAQLFMVSDAALQGGAVTYYDMSARRTRISQRSRRD